MHIIFLISLILLPFTTLPASTSWAQDNEIQCASAKDTPCLLRQLLEESSRIEEERWRDQTYRELAKLLTHKGKTSEALALIDKIVSTDTKAMTIRGIGMAAKSMNSDEEQYDALINELKKKAVVIEDTASQAIALRYIAKAQAVAGFDEKSRETGNIIFNQAQKHKAFEEIAEVQAKRGALEEVLKTISQIDSISYRNRSYSAAARIFTNANQYDKALAAANNIEGNAYLKAQAILYILVKQITPHEVSVK